jgi:hypothetical protein
MIQQTPVFWNISPADLLTQLETRQEGLNSEEAKRRLVSFGANLLKPPKRSDAPALLLMLLDATPEQFRTGWFMESVVSAAVIVLVIRSRRPFYKSRIGIQLLVATLAVVTAVLILPFTPLGGIFGFVPLPASFLLILSLIMILYIFTAEVVKKMFYRRLDL